MAWFKQNYQLKKMLKEGKRVHLIGIGGTGVSYLAHYFIDRGWRVSGSSLEKTSMIDSLVDRRAAVFVGDHHRKNIPTPVDLVVASSAVPENNPEWIWGREKAKLSVRHHEVVAEITKHYFTIAVAGSHGKSTTTALLGLMLKEAGFNPTVFVGAQVKEFGNRNYLQGGSVKWRRRRVRFLVVEADEFQRHFLAYRPKAVVLTRIDYEHPDVYLSNKEMIRAYHAFANLVPASGLVVAEENLAGRQVTKNIKARVVLYKNQGTDYKLIKSNLALPGKHNALNGLAAYRAARWLGCSREACWRVLGHFTGLRRRFERFFCYVAPEGLPRAEFTLINDYAHHPTEVRATLQTARAFFPRGRLIVCFQPHQAYRLTRFFDEFVDSFLTADCTIVLPVYEPYGREGFFHNQVSKSSNELAAALIARGKQARSAPSFSEARRLIEKTVRTGDAVLVMGAGSVNQLTEAMVKDRVHKG